MTQPSSHQIALATFLFILYFQLLDAFVGELVKKTSLDDIINLNFKRYYDFNVYQTTQLSKLNKHFYQLFANQSLPIPNHDSCIQLASRIKYRDDVYVINLNDFHTSLKHITLCSKMLYPSNQPNKQWTIEPRKPFISMHVAIYNHDIRKSEFYSLKQTTLFILSFSSEKVKQLMNDFDDIFGKDFFESVIYSAGKLATVELMCIGHLDQDKDYFIAASICFAASVGHLNELAMLLETKPRIFFWIIDGFIESFINTAFRFAARNKHIHILELLIDNGADVHFEYYAHSNLDHQNPLTVAAHAGHIDVVTFLLDKDTFDPIYVNSAFLNAVVHKHYDLAKLLINKGAEVDIYMPRKQRNIVIKWLWKNRFKRTALKNYLKFICLEILNFFTNVLI